MSDQPPHNESVASDKPVGRPKRAIRRRLRRILFSMMRIYLVVTLLLFLFQSKLMYFPHSNVSETPANWHLAFEDVTFEAADGVKLTGWFVPADKPRGVVLLCHGNGGNISHRLGLLSVLGQINLSVFIFDYRGYGRSEGSPDEQGTYLDAEAAWKYLTDTREIAPDEIIIMGRSMGGAIAAHLAGDHTPAALILESAFTSVKDLVAEKVPFFPVRWLLRYDYSTAEYLSRIHCPILVIHSRDDETCPFHHGLKLYELAPQPKQWLEISGTHNDGFLTSLDVYMAGLERFLSEHLPDSAPPAPGSEFAGRR